MMYFIWRIFKGSLQNFFRNFWLSMATVLVIIITLFLINIIISLDQLRNSIVGSLEQQIDISLDFKPRLGQAEVEALRNELAANPKVATVVTITPEENLQRFNERYPDIGSKVIPILETNPLGYTLKLRARQLEDYDALLAELQNERYSASLDRTNFNDYRLFTSKTAAVAERINLGAVVLALLFLIIAIIIIFNSIRVGIYTHRDEIGIMRLVGASNWLIRAPFLAEAVVYALIATIVTGFIVLGLLQMLQPLMNRYFYDILNVDLVNFYNHNLLSIFGWQALGVAALNIASTSVALRKYLKL